MKLPSGLEPSQRRVDPFTWYETMRSTEPVRYDEERERWDVFRYDDVRRVLSDYETFSSAGLSDFDSFDVLGTVLVDENPPEHDRLRGVVDEFFQPGNLESLRSSVRSIVDEQLDRTLEDGPAIDAIGQLTAPVTVLTISRLLGIPREDWDTVKQWSDVMGGGGASESEDWKDAQRTFKEIREYIGTLLEERRGEDRDDVISAITSTEASENALSKEEQISFCIFLFLAGHSTTTHAAGSVLWTLAEENQYENLRDGKLDRELTFEESLRYRGPVQSLSGRHTTEEVELSGVTIPAGEQVTSWIGSANRDPEVFDDPEQFQPDRRANRHIAFGFGPHVCLGAPLARLEGDTILDAVTDRIQDIELAEESFDPEPMSWPLTYGLDSLPMRFYGM
ncbi:cytochrome P450 [Halococcus hamelinensis 100A6]|uniref:Cytochrome P450 n=2 Tax=Halococcus hamelinensis TaxID=332168 RepID=M0LVK1_9EURY|nr:cytochrome P450 [Halococcus hamelinensis 100A6]